jgi:hypothetical protein
MSARAYKKLSRTSLTNLQTEINQGNARVTRGVPADQEATQRADIEDVEQQWQEGINEL